MKVIISNREVLLDQTGVDLLTERKWHVSDTGYVVWRGIIDGVKKTLRLHRLVIDAKPGEIVDHINRNKLDNRLANLRIVTQKQNVHNSDKMDRSKFYYFDKSRNRWTIDSKRLGARSVYVDSEQDAKQYVAALTQGAKPSRAFTKRPSIGGAKIDSRMARDIDRLYAGGRKRYQIAHDVGISPTAVGRYLSGKTWSKQRPPKSLKEQTLTVRSC